MSVAVMLFTSDLRLHDNPVLRAALRDADEVVPLFVRDDAVHRAGFDAPNRLAFLADCLAALDAGLRHRGGRLVVRRGEAAAVVRRVAEETGAASAHVAAGFSRYAARREERLREALAGTGCELRVHDAVVTALAPGRVVPSGGKDHFAVFTPYFRRWEAAGVRGALTAPRAVRVPDGVSGDPLPDRDTVKNLSPGLARGGEDAGRKLVTSWLNGPMADYEAYHDDLAGDATSRLSPICTSVRSPPPNWCTARGRRADPAARRSCGNWPGATSTTRSSRPAPTPPGPTTGRAGTAGAPTRTRSTPGGPGGRGIRWWTRRCGKLAHEGWMHNRGRMLAASFLTKTLYVDWRVGARHFLDLLVDGDVANNQLNWQWVAGTGTDTRPNRVLNPVIQGKRFDPRGDYVRRWVPELAELEGAAIHEPWKLQGLDRAGLDYPDPVVDLAEARARFERARGLD